MSISINGIEISRFDPSKVNFRQVARPVDQAIYLYVGSYLDGDRLVYASVGISEYEMRMARSATHAFIMVLNAKEKIVNQLREIVDGSPSA